MNLAMESNYKRRISHINIILGVHLGFEENYTEAIEHFKTALNIGEEVRDFLSVVLANNNMAICLSENNEFDRALSCFEKALRINVVVNSLWGIVAIKANTVIWVYCRQGKSELAYQTSQEALKLSDESGDSWSKGIAHGAHGYSNFIKGDLIKAAKHLSK